MKTYVLLYFEDINDVTIIIKLHRATRLRLVALYKISTMIVTSFFMFKIQQNIGFHATSVNYSMLIRPLTTYILLNQQ